ncbi:MAG: hypothetical protein AAF721_03290 [Myxococcota bacterium]
MGVVLLCACRPAAPRTAAPNPTPNVEAPAERRPVAVELTFLGVRSVEEPPMFFEATGRFTGYLNGDDCEIFDYGEYVGDTTREASQLAGRPFPCDDWIDGEALQRWSVDGTVSVTAEDDRIVARRSNRDARTLCEGCPSVGLAVSPDGASAVTATPTGELHLWNTITAERRDIGAVATLVPDWNPDDGVQLAWPDKTGLVVLVSRSGLPLCDEVDVDSAEVEEGVTCDWETLGHEATELRWSPSTTLVVKEGYQHFASDGPPVLNPVDGCVYYEAEISDGRADIYGVWDGCELDGPSFSERYGDDEDDWRMRVVKPHWSGPDGRLLVEETDCEGCSEHSGHFRVLQLPDMVTDVIEAPSGLSYWTCDFDGMTDDGPVTRCEACPLPPDIGAEGGHDDEDDADDDDDGLEDDEPDCVMTPAAPVGCDIMSRSPDGRAHVRVCERGDGEETILQAGSGATVTLAGSDVSNSATWTRESNLAFTVSGSVALMRGRDGEQLARIEHARHIDATLGHELGVVLVQSGRDVRVVTTTDGKTAAVIEGVGNADVTAAAIGPSRRLVALGFGTEVRIVDLPTMKRTRVQTTQAPRHLAWSADATQLYAGKDDASPAWAWTRAGEKAELPRILTERSGELDPTWRWRVSYDIVTRVSDGRSLHYDEGGVLLHEVGLYSGEHELLSDQVFIAGDDPLCSPIIQADDHPDLFERDDLARAFFAGERFPERISVPAGHPALETRCPAGSASESPG